MAHIRAEINPCWFASFILAAAWFADADIAFFWLRNNDMATHEYIGFLIQDCDVCCARNARDEHKCFCVFGQNTHVIGVADYDGACFCVEAYELGFIRG